MACAATRHITTQDFEEHMHVSMLLGDVSLEGKTDADTWQSDSKLMITHRHRKPAKENGESKNNGMHAQCSSPQQSSNERMQKEKGQQLRLKHVSVALHTKEQSLQAKSANSDVAGCLHSFFFSFGHISTVKRLHEGHDNIRNHYKLYRHKGRNSACGCSPGVIGFLVENVIPRDEVNRERKSNQEKRGEFEAGYHGRVFFTVRIFFACELVK
jgi:hypothetical protein